ncbi:MAG: ABC transporter ATP-binding protein [Rhodothermaceae bacterium]
MSTLIEVQNLNVQFKSNRNIIYAVNNLSFSLQKNEILAIIGESGCGKSVTCKSLLRLNNAYKESGDIYLNDQLISNYSDKEFFEIRGRKISMIFQDPGSSLNPLIKIGHQISEVIQLHSNLNKNDAYEKGIEVLKQLGIPNPSLKMQEYPHQQSGGINQRILIALACSCNPDVLIADEPTASLDVTIQKQILEIFINLKKQRSLIFVTHDLGVVKEIADRVIILYQGMLMEEGNKSEIFSKSNHPYTKALLDSTPLFNESKYILEGEPTTNTKLIPGCPFENRCPNKIGEICEKSIPSLTKKNTNVRCHLYT